MKNSDSKFMKIIKWIATNPTLIVLVLIRDLYELFSQIINNLKNMSPHINIDYFDIIIKLLLAALVMFLFKEFFKLKERNQIFDIISKNRLKNIYLSGYQGNNKYLEDMYFGYLIKEENEIRILLQKEFPKKSNEEIETILIEFYNELNRDKQ